MTTRVFCLLMIFLLTIFCAFNARLHAASNQYLRGKDCKAEANWALMLLKDRETIPHISVMPKDQAVLDMVLKHNGTKEELWWKVYGSCGGLST